MIWNQIIINSNQSSSRILLFKENMVLGPNIEVEVKSSQVSFIAWKIRKIGEASADTATTETYYMKGCYNFEEETIKVKSEQRRVVRKMKLVFIN